MPIYEYECQSCGTRVEALQRFNDPPLTTCECGEEGELKKLISAPAFQFKGDGWYVTDYARKKDDKGKEGGDKKEAKGAKVSGAKDSGTQDSAGTKAKDSSGTTKTAGSAAKD